MLLILVGNVEVCNITEKLTAALTANKEADWTVVIARPL